MYNPGTYFSTSELCKIVIVSVHKNRCSANLSYWNDKTKEYESFETGLYSFEDITAYLEDMEEEDIEEVIFTPDWN